jgi:hypothetical protein
VTGRTPIRIGNALESVNGIGSILDKQNWPRASPESFTYITNDNQVKKRSARGAFDASTLVLVRHCKPSARA